MLARHDNITLRDDPNFDLEFELLGATGHSSHDFGSQPSIHDSALFSPLPLDILSQDSSPSLPGLIIPPSASSIDHGPLGLELRGSSVSGHHDRGSRFESGLFRREEEETGLLEDPGFAFDAEGNLIEGTVDERASVMQSIRTPSVAAGEPSFIDPHSLSQRRDGRPGIEDAVSLMIPGAFSPR